MDEPLHTDYTETKHHGFYQVTINRTDDKIEILHHISPNYEKLEWMLFKGKIRSFEVELDYG